MVAPIRGSPSSEVTLPLTSAACDHAKPVIPKLSSTTKTIVLILFKVEDRFIKVLILRMKLFAHSGFCEGIKCIANQLPEARFFEYSGVDGLRPWC
jgi:hypothetical protein